MALRNAESPETTNTANTATADRPDDGVKNSNPGSAVAAAAKTAIGAAMKFKAALEGFENVIDPVGMEFGVFPKITVSLGGFMEDGKKLGDDVTIKLLSWNRRWLASPGSDDKEAGKFVKYSNDGVTIASDGSPLADYVQHLKDVEGYKEASIKEYFAIWGFLTFAEGKEISPADQRMVELQCSPQTVGQFKRHQIEHGMKVSQGLVPESDILKCHANTRKINNKDFGFASFTAG
jgi:hypothetical protein